MVEIKGALLIILVLYLLPLHMVEALRFELEPSQTKCISEEIKIKDISVGKYFVVDDTSSSSSDAHRLNARVTSPYGNKNGQFAHNVHYADNVESGEFGFTALENGNYMTCFWSNDLGPDAIITVEFQWKTGVAARDWTTIAKKGHIDNMELELRKMEDTVKSIHDDMLYLREREQEMQNINRKVSWRMAWLSLLSLVIILSVVGLQWWHLRNFFERKKIL